MVVAFVLAGAVDCLTIVLGRPLIPEFMSLAYTSADPVWLLWVAVVIAGPIFEELFFRGFLLAGFRASFLGPIGAVVLTSASWALIHLQYDAYDMSTIFVVGCVLGASRLKTGSVLLPIGMHILNNLIATIEAAAL
jgi:membrane protease YdiL (CAAX protease family)